jgi:hypothetical protein
MKKMGFLISFPTTHSTQTHIKRRSLIIDQRRRRELPLVCWLLFDRPRKKTPIQFSQATKD